MVWLLECAADDTLLATTGLSWAAASGNSLASGLKAHWWQLLQDAHLLLGWAGCADCPTVPPGMMTSEALISESGWGYSVPLILPLVSATASRASAGFLLHHR